MPTAEQIRVPETLLKKRKNQDKITAEKAAALAEKRKVYEHYHFLFTNSFIQIFMSKMKLERKI